MRRRSASAVATSRTRDARSSSLLWRRSSSVASSAASSCRLWSDHAQPAAELGQRGVVGAGEALAAPGRARRRSGPSSAPAWLAGATRSSPARTGVEQTGQPELEPCPADDAAAGEHPGRGLVELEAERRAARHGGAPDQLALLDPPHLGGRAPKARSRSSASWISSSGSGRSWPLAASKVRTTCRASGGRRARPVGQGVGPTAGQRPAAARRRRPRPTTGPTRHASPGVVAGHRARRRATDRGADGAAAATRSVAPRMAPRAGRLRSRPVTARPSPWTPAPRCARRASARSVRPAGRRHGRG